MGHSPEYPGHYGGGAGGAGTGRHRAPAEDLSVPLVPPDPLWDPAEELAFMLQDAMEEGRPRIPAPRDEVSVAAPVPGSPMGTLQEITAELPPLRDAARSHRKVRERRHLGAVRTIGRVVAALVAVGASAVSLFSAVVAYDPLRAVAESRMQVGSVAWWPLLVYGPWLVASLSVLRAALYQRRATHSWCVVLGFSVIGMLLCVAQAPRTATDIAAAALPGLASLACFQQLVRQITLTRPPRRATPRHRLRPPAPDAGVEAEETAAPSADEDAPVVQGAQPDGAPGPRPAGPASRAPEPGTGTYVISDCRTGPAEPGRPRIRPGVAGEKVRPTR
ncbi:DUF2637 domain-containing protein [Streptomyces sp. HMX87]|uniref:DUF2637 domain-containing protein n=1 Tax=Streptomyces sp. HMX87 TaxID=3390849 RepID=UPI003A86E333